MRRGQIATEYVILVGIVLVLLIPTMIIFTVYTTDSEYQTDLSQTQAISKEIIKQAESIYYLGEGSQNTIDVRFPGGIEYVLVDDNSDEIVFVTSAPTGAQSQVAVRSNVDIQLGKKISGETITLPSSEGTHRLKIVATSADTGGIHVCITTPDGVCPSTAVVQPPPPTTTTTLPGSTTTTIPGGTTTTTLPPSFGTCDEYCTSLGNYDISGCSVLPSQPSGCTDPLGTCSNDAGYYHIEDDESQSGVCASGEKCYCYTLVCCPGGVGCSGQVCNAPGISMCSGAVVKHCDTVSDGVCPLDYQSAQWTIPSQVTACCSNDPDCTNSQACDS